MENYLDYIPTDLFGEILLYLSIEDIEILSQYNIKYILESRIFWIKRLQYEHLNLYIPLLGRLKEEYFYEYAKFLSIEIDVSEFIYYFKEYSAYMSIKISGNDITKLIDNDIETFIENVDSSKYDCGVAISSKRKKILYHSNCIESLDGSLSDEEFRLLLIKLTISGFNLHELSNLDEIISELSEINDMD